MHMTKETAQEYLDTLDALGVSPRQAWWEGLISRKEYRDLVGFTCAITEPEQDTERQMAQSARIKLKILVYWQIGDPRFTYELGKLDPAAHKAWFRVMAARMRHDGRLNPVEADLVTVWA